MQFPDFYFEDEVRDGFYVPGMMKRAWAAQLEILEDIDKVCKKHGIQYFAEWGTLLGAVRHGGFIPWDDDMDICMKRADYNRFLAVAKEELPGYSLLNCHNVYNGEIYWGFLTRVVNGKQVNFTEEHLDKFHGFPYVTGLDIFSMDFVAPAGEEFIQAGLVNLVAIAIQSMDSACADEEEKEERLCQVEELCNVRLNRAGNVKQQLYFLMERLFSMYSEQEAEKITLMPLGLENPNLQIPKAYYQEIIRLPFENTEIPVPAAYDAILRKKYGNYLKPVRSGGAHEYPFYKRQEQVLEETYGIKLPKYVFSTDNLYFDRN